MSAGAIFFTLTLFIVTRCGNIKKTCIGRDTKFQLNFGLHNKKIKKNKRPLTPKSMPPAGDEHAKLKT